MLLNESKKKLRNRCARWLSLCLLLGLLFGCGSKDHYTGTYQVEAADSPRQTETVVELKPNGEGAWKFADQEVSFSWDVKDSELRINTKEGGVLVGRIENDVIHLTLPGTPTLAFKKVQ